MSSTLESTKEVTKDVPVVPESGEPVLPSRSPFWLKVSAALFLVFGGLTVLLAPMGLGWVFGVGMLTTFGGEALSRTGGLEPHVFEVSYWMSLWLNVAVVGWSVVRRFRGKVHPWRPLFWAMIVQVVVAGVFVTLDAQGVIDMPDVLTTTAMLGVAWLWTYALPLVLLFLVFRVVWVLWRLSAKSDAAARRVIAGCAMVMLATIFLLGTPAIPGVRLEIDQSRRLEVWRGPPGDSRTEHKVYVKASVVVTSHEEEERTANAEDKTQFSRCMRALGESSDQRSSTIAEAVQKLASRLRIADAQDLVYATLLKVCIRQTKQAVLELKDYFWAALRNARSTFCRVSTRQVTMSPHELPEVEACPSFMQSADVSSLMRAMRHLPEKKQRVLYLQFYEGRSHREIGEILGIGEGAARQLSSRAIGDLREALGAL